MTCEHCEDAPATEKIRMQLDGVSVGPPIAVCKDCASELCDA